MKCLSALIVNSILVLGAFFMNVSLTVASPQTEGEAPSDSRKTAELQAELARTQAALAESQSHLQTLKSCVIAAMSELHSQNDHFAANLTALGDGISKFGEEAISQYTLLQKKASDSNQAISVQDLSFLAGVGYVLKDFMRTTPFPGQPDRGKQGGLRALIGHSQDFSFQIKNSLEACLD